MDSVREDMHAAGVTEQRHIEIDSDFQMYIFLVAWENAQPHTLRPLATPASLATVLGVTPLSCSLPLQHNKQWPIQCCAWHTAHIPDLHAHTVAARPTLILQTYMWLQHAGSLLLSHADFHCFRHQQPT